MKKHYYILIGLLITQSFCFAGFFDYLFFWRQSVDTDFEKIVKLQWGLQAEQYNKEKLQKLLKDQKLKLDEANQIPETINRAVWSEQRKRHNETGKVFDNENISNSLMKFKLGNFPGAEQEAETLIFANSWENYKNSKIESKTRETILVEINTYYDKQLTPRNRWEKIIDRLSATRESNINEKRDRALKRLNLNCQYKHLEDFLSNDLKNMNLEQKIALSQLLCDFKEFIPYGSIINTFRTNQIFTDSTLQAEYEKNKAPIDRFVPPKKGYIDPIFQTFIQSNMSFARYFLKTKIDSLEKKVRPTQEDKNTLETYYNHRMLLQAKENFEGYQRHKSLTQQSVTGSLENYNTLFNKNLSIKDLKSIYEKE